MIRVLFSAAALVVVAEHVTSSFLQALPSETIQAMAQDAESHQIMGQRNNQELIEQLKREQWEMQNIGNEFSEKTAESLNKKSDDTVRITDYSDTMRAGGLEGSVGGGAVYDTPNKLQDEVLAINAQVNASISNFTPTRSIPELLVNLKAFAMPDETIRRLSHSIPYFQYISELLHQSCPAALSHIGQAGDPDKHEAFPACLVRAVAGLDAASKKDFGLRIRAALTDVKQIDALFNVKSGVCPIVQEMLNLPRPICQELSDLFYSVAQFIKISQFVQKEEKKIYGEEASMLQLHQQEDGSLQSAVDYYSPSSADSTAPPSAHAVVRPHNGHAADRIAALRARLLFRSLWNNFGLATLRVEAQHLVDVWWNDPIHKWRYAIGLFQFFTLSGLWLSEAANAL